MKIRRIVEVILITGVIALLCGCPPAPVDVQEGGGGADFDPTLYYTKTEAEEVFATLSGVEETYVKKTSLDPAINASMPTRVVNGDGITLAGGTNTDWASGTSFTFPLPGFTPAYEFALLFATPWNTYTDTDGFILWAGTSDADKAGFSLPGTADGTLLGTSGLIPLTNESRFWVEGLDNGLIVTVRAVFFNDWQ